MGDDNTTVQAAQAASLFAGEAWFDPIEAGIRERIRRFIEALFEEELSAAWGRGRGERAIGAPRGYRNGTRERHLLGSFGPVQVSVPRARMADTEGGTREWRSAALPRYARMPPAGGGADRRGLSGRDQHAPHQARARRPVPGRGGQGCGQPYLAQGEGGLGGLEPARSGRRGGGAPGPGRHGRARQARRKATNVSLLVVLGVRRDGQKLLLAVRNMGGESEAAWRCVLDDLIAR